MQRRGLSPPGSPRRPSERRRNTIWARSLFRDLAPGRVTHFPRRPVSSLSCLPSPSAGPLPQAAARRRSTPPISRSSRPSTAPARPRRARRNSSSTPANTTTTRCRDAFFRDLGIPEPDVNLGVGSASPRGANGAHHGAHSSRSVERERPDLGAWSTATSTPPWPPRSSPSKLGDPRRARRGGPAQLRPADAGGDQPHRHRPARGSAAHAVARRRREPAGAKASPTSEIVFVGNVMIDSLLHALPAARASGFRGQAGRDGDAVVVTLHRPSNVDDPRAPGRHRRRRCARFARLRLVSSPRIRARGSDCAMHGIDLGGVQLLEPGGLPRDARSGGRARTWWSPIPADSRRRRRRSACRASRCARTPSGP